jgi:hypothetical protein
MLLRRAIAYTLRSNYLCGSMLNRAVAYVLLVSLISANFSRLFVYAGYELNKQYIATKLCENRDKPWMHCNGRCYFMDKIKQVQEKEKSAERQTQKSLFQEVCYTSETSVTFHTQLLTIITTPYRTPIAISYSGVIFHPPQLG